MWLVGGADASHINSGKCITNRISQAVTLLSLACVKLQNTASDLGKN